MIRPIPKKLLIHSAELITEFSPDKWGKPRESERVQLKNVRIEPSAKHIIGGSDRYVHVSKGEIVQLAAVLFFDCRNSSPGDVAFALKDDLVNEKSVLIQKVCFGTRQFTVQTVEALYANGIHHYEIGLV